MLKQVITLATESAVFLLLWTVICCADETFRVRVSAAKTRAAQASQPELPDTPPNIDLPQPKPNVEAVPEKTEQPGLSLSIEPSSVGPVLTRYAVTVYSASWCWPCESMKRKCGDGDERLKLTWLESRPPAGIPETYPCAVWRDASGTLIYTSGVKSLDELVLLIERNNPPLLTDGAESTVDATEGTRAAGLGGGLRPAGVLHGRPQITAVLDWIRANVGEDVPMRFQWDRTGAQTFPLLRNQDWSAEKLFGRSGRFELSASGAKKLPVSSVGFAYAVRGDDVSLDLDPVLVKGLAKRIEPSLAQSEAVGAAPAGFVDPLTAWTVFSVLRSIWGVLNPQADLTLGGNVACEAVLHGDLLTVTFHQMPRIRLHALFTFNLGVERVELSAEKCRLVFSGSRWIRERTCEVK